MRCLLEEDRKGLHPEVHKAMCFIKEQFMVRLNETLN